MKDGSWASGFLLKGFGCRCWANLCGVDARTISKRSRDVEREYERNVGTLEDDGWTGGVDETSAPDFASITTPPPSEEIGASPVSLSDTDHMPNNRLRVLDEHMSQLNSKLTALTDELRRATSERMELVNSFDMTHGSEAQSSDFHDRLAVLHPTSLANDFRDGEMSGARQEPGSHAMPLGEGGHSRHDSSCNPDSGTAPGDEGENRYTDEIVRSPATSSTQQFGDRMIFEQMLEMGDGEFVMDDEIDDISDVNLSGLGDGDLPTPRAIPHPDAFGLDMLGGEANSGALDGLSEVGVGMEDDDDDDDGNGGSDDLDDPGSLDVANPPFTPLETQASSSSNMWERDFGENFDDDNPCKWLSNKTFGGSPSSSGTSPTEPSDDAEEESSIQFRTTHVALLERANRANALTLELAQMRLALEDAQSQLEFTTERMITYKKSLQSEQIHAAEEAGRHQVKLNEATSSKFIMFCKLQKSQARIVELEEENARLRQSNARGNFRGNLRGDCVDGGEHLASTVADECEEEEEEGGEELTGGGGREKLTTFVGDLCESGPSHEHHDQGVSRPLTRTDNAITTTQCTHAQEETAVNNHPLHEALSRTMRQLLDAEARGDRLQRQVDHLQSQLIGSKSTSTQTTGPQPSSSMDASQEVKKAQAEVKRLQGRLQKVEGELVSSKEAKTQLDKNIRKLKKEIKGAKRGDGEGRAPRWR